MKNNKEFTRAEMKSFADWCRNGLTNLEYSYLKLDKHLKKWQILKKEHETKSINLNKVNYGRR